MSESRPILPAPNLLDLIDVRADTNVITLRAKTSTSAARCPVCGKRSGRIHSRYTRTLTDLPWQGVPVSIHLNDLRMLMEGRIVSSRSRQSHRFLAEPEIVAAEGSTGVPPAKVGYDAFSGALKRLGGMWDEDLDTFKAALRGCIKEGLRAHREATRGSSKKEAPAPETTEQRR